MRRILPLAIVAAALLTAGCSSFETIPLSDEAETVSEIQVPVPVPRTVAAAGIAAPSAAASPLNDSVPPLPVARPTAERGALEPRRQAAELAVAALAGGLHQIGEIAIGTANAGEAKAVREIRFEEASTPATGHAQPAAAALEAPADPEAIERRDVKAIEGCVNDVFRTCPRTIPAVAEVSDTAAALSAGPRDEIASATIGLLRAASFDTHTVLWVLIGFAALLGLFFSARRSAD